MRTANARQTAGGDPLRHWDRFAEIVRRRLERGHRDYAGSSFRRSPDDLVAEIEEELADVLGWGFILWTRLEQLRIKIRKASGTPRSTRHG